ncbi:class I SAM-dependent DNA methyltransferase [Amycolatopsis sp. NPDC058986]|uniref:class I SAM-dependent DNA methyltransferase n=1 Tax=unclassified Amycolatopsis TaxID=2618356 RepID=UPI00366E8CEA
MYQNDFAEIYDHIHAHRGKDYAAEAAELAALVRARMPQAASVLDVACGTGGHLKPLAELFGSTAGLELSEDMIAIARRRVPEIPLSQGDMRDFRLDGSFDAVTCMFSSIGYLRTPAELGRTLRCFARHLTAGGVVVIEPWVFPETFVPGYVASDLVRLDGRAITRISHSVREGDVTRMDVHYLDAGPAGIRHLTDTHRLSLFSRADYETAFARAGCSAEYVVTERFPRGLFVGVRTAAPATDDRGAQR